MVRLVAALSLAALAGCYAPKLEDCRIKCGPNDACPSGTECTNGLCRLPGARGVCECVAGEERPCGGGLGACTPGTQRCQNDGLWGACVGEGRPSVEVCDGVDNDCNGQVDDNVLAGPACPLTRGVCAGKTRACVDGGFETECSAATYGPDYQAYETRCDGKDNDCDGEVDQQGPYLLMSDVDYGEVVYLDGGYSVVTSADFHDGGFNVSFRHFDSRFTPTTGVVPVPGVRGAPLPWSMRSVGANGVTYAVWFEDDPDAGFPMKASTIDRAGVATPLEVPAPQVVTVFPDLGLSDTTLLAAWTELDGSRVRGAQLPLASLAPPTLVDYYDVRPGSAHDGLVLEWSVTSPLGSAVLWSTRDPASPDAGLRQLHLGPADAGAEQRGPFPKLMTEFQLLEGPGAPPGSAWVEDDWFVYRADDPLDAGSYEWVGETQGNNTIDRLRSVQLAGGSLFVWAETDPITTKTLLVADFVPSTGARAPRTKFLQVDAGVYFHEVVPGDGEMVGLTFYESPGQKAGVMGLLFCPP
jgi:hypothetical protein